MNTDTITRWLKSPDMLPDESRIQSELQIHPWFVPARLMEAAHLHRRRPFAPDSLAIVHLYGTDWVSSYSLMAAVGNGPATPEPAIVAEEKTAPASEKAAVEAIALPETPEEPQTPRPAQEANRKEHKEPPLIQPLYTEDYFRHQGLTAETEAAEAPPADSKSEDPRTLMVVMSFAEWLSHFKIKSQREEEEERDKRALRSMWQQEKLAAALEDEPDEIPEEVFEMAVSSITREDDLASESLAEILEKQGKWTAAAEMYKKLGLRNPAKSTYFASRAEAAKKRAS